MGIDADAMRGERQGHDLGELVDAALRYRIGHLVGDGEYRVDRREVDDGAGRAAGLDALHHVARHRLAAEERTLQVDAQHAIEIGFRQIEEIHRGQNRGVVDQHVDLPERGNRRGDQVGDRGRIAHVAGDKAHGADRAKLGDQCRAAIRIDVGRHHARALLQEPAGDGFADAARGAGYNDNLVFQRHGRFSRFFRNGWG
jgi:hypothetical protein